MNEFVKRIQDERAKLQQEAAETQRKIDALDEVEKIFQSEQTLSSHEPTRPTRQPVRKIIRQADNGTTHADIAEKILRERGPLKAEAIARLFADEGSRTTTNSIRTILSREKGKRFERSKGGEWRVKASKKRG